MLTKKLQIKYPIIQAPMFGVTTPQMVAAAGNAGFLGSAALGDLDSESSSRIIRECKQLTREGFAANIFANQIPEITQELKSRYQKTRQTLRELSEKLNLKVDFPDIENVKPSGYHEQAQAILEENIKILSFTFGNLDSGTIEKFKEKGVTLIGTCTSEEEAQALIQSEIDIICVQGIEAGGHRGSFSNENIPQIGGLSLLQNVRQMTKLPILYAGGIANKKTIDSVKTLGADGFQVGTILLCSKESALTESEKQRLATAQRREIVLTKSFSGRYARGLKNDFIDLFENAGYILPYPYQNKLTAPFRKAARQANLVEYVNLWAGQSLGNLSFDPTDVILKTLI
ncbi:nitronate monooxygenase [Flavobacterium sp.]|uniref:NAD(P)H-dependent flavin oxidoreductase n=1 Tax=Flavobacterium sp. TaxID=239 RepID=UPI00122BE805|nr:nitronate monooxygenase [Flavobacterium sp.]RZJ70525.1 MAG: nitronate monooxygenase [Flavobacterium sp.]